MQTINSSVVLGAGPLGRTIAETLAAEQKEVTVVTRDGRTIGRGIKSAKADLTNATETIQACAGADAIYFCAAPPYHEWTEVFPVLQDVAIQAASATGAILVAVENLYGYGTAGVLHEDLPLAATTRKGGVRARMSEQLLNSHEAGKVTAVAGRATDFFGPSVKVSALGERFWPALLSGKPVDWIGDPDAPHSFAYLPDLAKAYIALAENAATWGQAWHMPALPSISGREICTKVTGPDVEAKMRPTPSWVLRAVGLFQPAAKEMIEMRYMFDNPFEIDHSRFSQAVGRFETTWDDAIAETTAWWLEADKAAAA